MTRHILACGSQYSWCTGQHVKWWIPLSLGAVFVVLVTAGLIARHRP